MIDILIRGRLKQKNKISLGTLKFCYIRYFLLKQYFVQCYAYMRSNS